MIVLNSGAPGSVLLLLALSTLSAACSGGSRAEPASVESRRAVVEKEAKPTSPQRAPQADAESTETTGEVPPQLLAIFQDDLARRALVKHETITVVSATEHEWSDGAMGCPQPGMMYTQALVPGYRVVLKANDEKYAYHSDRRGNFIVCANGQAFQPAKKQVKGKPPAE